jgi:hypothetical protein
MRTPGVALWDALAKWHGMAWRSGWHLFWIGPEFFMEPFGRSRAGLSLDHRKHISTSLFQMVYLLSDGIPFFRW